MITHDKYTSFPPISQADFVIVFVMLFLSGNPALMSQGRGEILTVLVSFILLLMLVIRPGETIATRFVIVALMLLYILIAQCVVFHYWPVRSIAGFLFRLFLGYAAVQLVLDFPGTFIRAMYWICLLSWPFHLLAVIKETVGLDLIHLFGPLDSIANPYRGFHIIVHNYLAYARVPEYSFYSPWRNSSFFWEPGAFAAYILLAIIFLGLRKDMYDRRQYRKIIVVLSVTVLSTMSTAGYLLLLLCLVFHVRNFRLTSRQIPALLVISMVLTVCIYAGMKLPFIGQKLRSHFEAVDRREQAWEQTRFGSLLYDLESIHHRPILGWGLSDKTRYALNSGQSLQKLGNGLSDFTVKFGLLGLATVLAATYVGSYRLAGYSSLKAIVFVAFIVLVLNSQPLFDYPVFLSLLFLESNRKIETQNVWAVPPRRWAGPIY